MYSKLLIAALTFFAVSAQAEDNRVVLTKQNTLTMNSEFDSESVAKLTQAVRTMDSDLKSNEPIYIVMNSPGGSIDDGIELIENLSNMNRPIKTITLFSASMGFHTVQGLGERLITENGTLMSHKASGGFFGEFPGQLDNRYSYYLKRIRNMDDKVVARTKGKHTAKSYASLMENEYWCDGKECIKQGFADRVVRPTCNKSLDGTHNEDLKFSFGGMAITVRLVVSNCPLTTGVLSYDIFIGGEQLHKEPGTVTYYSNTDKLSAADIQTITVKAKELVNSRSNKNKVIRY